MLYPLSYEGARAQSSELGVIGGGREWPTLTHRSPAAIRPAQDHARSLHVTPVDRDGQGGSAGAMGSRRRGPLPRRMPGYRTLGFTRT